MAISRLSLRLFPCLPLLLPLVLAVIVPPRRRSPPEACSTREPKVKETSSNPPSPRNQQAKAVKKGPGQHPPSIRPRREGIPQASVSSPGDLRNALFRHGPCRGSSWASLALAVPDAALDEGRVAVPPDATADGIDGGGAATKGQVRRHRPSGVKIRAQDASRDGGLGNARHEIQDLGYTPHRPQPGLVPRIGPRLPRAARSPCGRSCP